MYDIMETQANPSMARLLVKTSRLTGMVISQEIKDLAKTDLLDPTSDPILNAPCKGQIRVVQDLYDLKGRGMFLTSDPLVGRQTAVLTSLVLGSSRTIIVTSEESYKEWIDAIYQQTGEKASYLTKYVTYDNTARWIIGTAKLLKKYKVFKDQLPDHMICDVLPEKIYVDVETQGGWAKEVTATTVMLNVSQVPNLKYDLTNNSGAVHTMISYSYTGILWNDFVLDTVRYKIDGSAGSYLRSRGYLSTSLKDIYPLMGINLDQV